MKLDELISVEIVIKGTMIVERGDGRLNCICKGGLILDEWMEEINPINDKILLVYNDRSYNFIGKDRKLITDKWFDEVYDFNDDVARVKRKENGYKEAYNFIDENGIFISGRWFDLAYDFENGFAIVKDGSKCNLINGNGNPVSNEWFSYVDDFHDGFARVKRENGSLNFIDEKGILYDKHKNRLPDDMQVNLKKK